MKEQLEDKSKFDLFRRSRSLAVDVSNPQGEFCQRAEFLGNRFHGYALPFPFSKVSGKPLTAMKVSKGRDADPRGDEKGREDEETDSTIVEAMGRKDGRGKRNRLGS